MQAATLAALEASIAEHPWRTVGRAFLIGAWLAAEPPYVPRSRIARSLFAMIGSLTLRVAREVSLRELLAKPA